MNKDIEKARKCAYYGIAGTRICTYYPYTTPCTYPNCDKKDLFWGGAAYKPMKDGKRIIGQCVNCGEDLTDHIYGNMCRSDEHYCKECFDKLPEEKKKLLGWHFSQDML